VGGGVCPNVDDAATTKAAPAAKPNLKPIKSAPTTNARLRMLIRPRPVEPRTQFGLKAMFALP
jgi:hypothetical protein